MSKIERIKINPILHNKKEKGIKGEIFLSPKYSKLFVIKEDTEGNILLCPYLFNRIEKEEPIQCKSKEEAEKILTDKTDFMQYIIENYISITEEYKKMGFLTEYKEGFSFDDF